MKKLVTAAAILAAFTLPAFAEADSIGGAGAEGEAHGSYIASEHWPQDEWIQQDQFVQVLPAGHQARAQAPLPHRRVTTHHSATTTHPGADTYMGYSAESLRSPTGADGGNRK